MTEERFEQIKNLLINDSGGPWGPLGSSEEVAKRTGIPLTELEEWHVRANKIIKENKPQIRELLQRAIQENDPQIMELVRSLLEK